jgi:signal peptidase I
MEGSLKVGDFLFVSKAHYGIRTPKTVLMLPLLHNRVPVIGGESYISKPNLPFYRLPARCRHASTRCRPVPTVWGSCSWCC